MDTSEMAHELAAAEVLLAGGQAEQAVGALSALARDAADYVDANCPTTQEVQYFSFPTIFDRLAYRRVENDPRELRPVGEPLDRLYSDLAFALLQTGDYDAAAEALKQAIRWNPMNCAARLDLAELYRIEGDLNEWLALSYTVFSRAAEPAHLVRAYTNFARYYRESGQWQLAAACLAAALRFGAPTPALEALVEQVKAQGLDPAAMTAQQVEALLEPEGLPEGANAEIAVCLLMCATTAAEMGDRKQATQFTIQARNLVGEKAAAALLALIRGEESD